MRTINSTFQGLLNGLPLLLRKEPLCKKPLKVKHRVVKLQLLEINVGENKKNIISKCNVKLSER